MTHPLHTIAIMQHHKLSKDSVAVLVASVLLANCEINQFKKRHSWYFDLAFLRLGLITPGLWCILHGGSIGWRTCFTSWQPEAERRRALCPNISFKDMSPVTQLWACLLKGFTTSEQQWKQWSIPGYTALEGNSMPKGSGGFQHSYRCVSAGLEGSFRLIT